MRKHRRNRRLSSGIAVWLAVCTAVSLISSVIPTPFSAPKGNLVSAAVTGNLRRVSAHDPAIYKENGTYYIFGSHVTAATSTDLANWSAMMRGEYSNPDNNALYGNFATTFAEPFKWAGCNDSDCLGGYGIWAPDPIYNPDYVNSDGTKGAYMLYLCTSSTYCRSAIGFVTAKSIGGPYTNYGGTLIYSGFTNTSQKDENSNIDKIYTNTNIDELIADGTLSGTNSSWFGGPTGYNTSYAPNAIDPTVFRDKSNKLWMTYGSWSGGLFILELDPTTGQAKYPGKDGTTSDGRVIDRYFGTKIAGGYGKSGEGPYILYDEETDYYYLYETYEYLDRNSGYNMRLYRSKSPDGPYTDAAGNSAVLSSDNDNYNTHGIKVMGNYSFSSMTQQYRSPGHNSVLIDTDGQRYLIYHTRLNADNEYHEVRVHQQFINEQGWPVTAVFENRGDSISNTGYSSGDIVGTYEFINHGTTSDKSSVKTPGVVQLNADGSISGDAAGTWDEKDNSYLATFVIGGITYSGVFFRQSDESKTHSQVMTFTAIGTNNETIWGVRNDSASSSKDVVLSGSPATHFNHINTQPVMSWTYDSTGNLTLSGEATISNGHLRLINSGTKGQTYAKFPSVTSYDFSKGITLTTDLAVHAYVNDWTPVIGFGDVPIGQTPSKVFRLTQGFSACDEPKTTEYYGVSIASPYKYDWYKEESNQNQWNTLTLTMTPTTITTYIDGKQVQTATGNYSNVLEIFKYASNNYLGAFFYNEPDFSGYLDNTAIYNVALSADEVKKLTEQWESDITPTPATTPTPKSSATSGTDSGSQGGEATKPASTTQPATTQPAAATTAPGTTQSPATTTAPANTATPSPSGQSGTGNQKNEDSLSLSLSESTVTLYTGQSKAIRATVDASDNSLSEEDVTWISQNAKVASVSSDGTIKALKKGTTVITATIKDVSKTVKVTVKKSALKVKSGKKYISGVTLKKGKKKTYKIVTTPAGAKVSLSGMSSKARKIASVTLSSKKLKIKGKKKGKFTVTLKATGATKKFTIKIK